MPLYIIIAKCFSPLENRINVKSCTHSVTIFYITQPTLTKATKIYIPFCTGYVEAIGRTAVSLQPTKPLILRGEVSRQYSTDNKSPLLNTRVLTRWSYNGVPITQPLDSDQPTLSFNRTQESDTGEYVLSVSHFYISRGFDRNNETEGNMLGIAGDINRQCSDIVLSTLGLYAIFSPVEFQVNIGEQHSVYNIICSLPST